MLSIPNRAWGALVCAGLLGAALSACAPAPPVTVYDSACAGSLIASVPGSVASGAIDELSGIVASRRNPGVWWVQNDSGNPNAVYAIGDDGRDLGTFTLAGATNVDWEDIAVGPGPIAGTDYLYVGDIGNSVETKRNAVVVYRVPEPVVSPSTSSGAVSLAGATRLEFSYPGGATPDAEALLVDPTNGDIFVVTKVLGGAAEVFRANPGTSMWDPVTTVPVALVTAADVAPAGDVVALVTYTSVVVYPRPAGGSLADAFGQAPCAGGFPTLTPSAMQYEAVGFAPDGRAYVVASEGAHPPLHRFHAP